MKEIETVLNSSADSIFEYYPPRDRFIGIVSIPHSGETIPEEFSGFLDPQREKLDRDVDTGVHKLVNIEELNSAGISVLKANIHRVCVDLNRAPEVCVLNWKSNSHGEKIVVSEPEEQEAALLAQKYHAPYYEMIKALINELSTRMERPSFIDLHSMPSKPTQYHLNINPNQAKTRPDFCLSDIEGKSCEPSFINYAAEQLEHTYGKVNKNDPYFGGHVTRHVDAKFPKTNNIQIEISRGIYLDESTRTLDEEKAAKLKPVLTNALISTFERFANR